MSVANDPTETSASSRADWKQIVDYAIAQTAAAFDCRTSGHKWWTEQQTGHTRCAYCPEHK